MPRLNEAGDLLGAIRAATGGLLTEKKDALLVRLKDRAEVLG